MSISGFRRSDDFGKYWSEDRVSESSDQLEITSSKRSSVNPRFDEYRFPNQVLIYGKFVFHHEGRRGYNPTSNGRYMYRPASGILLVHTRQNSTDDARIVDEFDSALGGAANIHTVKSLDRESLYEFFSKAENTMEMTFRGDEGIRTVKAALDSGDIENESIIGHLNSHPIVSAKASFVDPETEKRVVVNYDRGQFNIRDQSPDDSDYMLSEAGEYVIQLVEHYLFDESDE